MTYTSYPAHPAKRLILTLTSFTLTIPCALCQENNSRTSRQQQAEKLNPSTSRAATSASSTPASTNSSYVIRPVDFLAINALHEPEVSQKGSSADGKIKMPLIGEIQAGGMVPDALQAGLQLDVLRVIIVP